MKFKHYIKCVCCNKIPSKGKSLINLKKLPITDIFVKKVNKFKKNYLDQSVMFCADCEHLFLKYHILPKYIYNNNYGLSSSKTYSAIQANNDFIKFINLNLKKTKLSKVIEIGSNDLYLLKKFNKKKRELIGIDPVIKKDKNFKNIKTIQNFFYNIKSNQLGDSADLIICGHTLEHVEDPDLFLKKVLSISGNNTKIFFQFPSLESLIGNVSLDQIHHQHLNIFSLRSFNKILEKYGGKIINYGFNEFHYGALMVYFTLKTSKYTQRKKINVLPKITSKMILSAFFNFKNYLTSIEKTLKSYLEKKKKFYVIAAGSLLPILNYHMNGIINKADAILDDDPRKKNKFFPNINAKILKLKSANLENSICLIGSVHSHITTRKIINFLTKRKAEIIILPSITF